MKNLNSIYGTGAHMYFNDPIKGKQFIYECYNEISDNRKEAEKHFGADLVEDIFTFVDSKVEKNDL